MVRPHSASWSPSRVSPGLLVASLVAASLAPLTARADANAYVFVPYTDAGVWRLGYAFGTEQARSGERESAHAVSLGVSPTARWFTSVYAGWYREPGAPLVYDAWSWFNHVQLTPPGASPLDAGLSCEVERPRERDEGTKVTCGPTFQLDTDRLQFNLNTLFEKAVHAEDAASTALSYQWQVKGLWRPHLELGAQGFGSLGTWDHWLPASQQEHTVGPAVFAKWATGPASSLNLDAAWLIGVGAGSPRDTLRVRVEQTF